MPVRPLFLSCSLCFALGITSSQEGRPQEKSSDHDAPKARREQLLELAKSDDEDPRALQELALTGMHDASTRRALLALLPEKDRNEKEKKGSSATQPFDSALWIPYWLVDASLRQEPRPFPIF
jgi:hypothetical protein